MGRRLRRVARGRPAVCALPYRSRAQFVALHFDDFRCGNKSVHCVTTGCLHEVYLATNGRYRRVLAVHARDIRLINYQNTAAVEISGGVGGKTRTLRWHGGRFDQ